jgi:hypothetical protein
MNQHRSAIKTLAAAEAVDREKQVLRGYVVAQAGPFKSEGRGEFDRESLEAIVKLGNKADNGLKSRLGHPTMSDDGIGKFLGRSRELRMSVATDARTNKRVDAVRANLYFDPTAKNTPHGNLADYVMGLAESDPGAFSSSLVLSVEEEFRLNKDGTEKADEEGKPLPPLWRPKKLFASDFVDTGDAADAVLEAQEWLEILGLEEGTPELEKAIKKATRYDNFQRLVCRLLDAKFRKMPREEIQQRCANFLKRYLDDRFGEEPVLPPTPVLDQRAARLAKLQGGCERQAR